MNAAGAPSESSTTIVPVLVIHDGYKPGPLDDTFAADWRRRQQQGGPNRRFERYGTPCDTKAQAEGHIRFAARLDADAPAVVLIDLMLRMPGMPGELAEDGISVMRLLKTTYEERGKPVPPCVLWTGRIDDLVEYAFHHYGGTHIADRAQVPDLSDVLAVLWQAVDGTGAWRPRPRHPDLQLGRAEVELLPYLRLGWRPAAIAAALGVTSTAISGRTNSLRGRVNDHATLLYNRKPEDKRPPAPPRSLTADDGPAIAQYCLDHGYYWLEPRFA